LSDAIRAHLCSDPRLRGIESFFEGMSFISLWAGNIEPPGELPSHLKILYQSLSHLNVDREPGVCAEFERVPVEELLEPFDLPERHFADALAAAQQNSLRLANTVVAIHTPTPLHDQPLKLPGCELRYIGTFPVSAKCGI